MADDGRVDKRRVTMRSVIALPGVDEEGRQLLATHEATDYVRPDHLDAYVAEARTRWQVVEISDEPDAGPGGYDGQTHVPEAIDTPDAGTTYPATEA